MSNNSETTNGIAEILRVILVLQQSASCPESILDSCDKPVLGCCTTNCCVCNTRPVMIYTCCPNGATPVSMPISRDIVIPAEGESSSVFRVEKVEDDTATFRVLAPNPDTTSASPYVATNSFFTLNIGCACAIRCLNDTCVENI